MSEFSQKLDSNILTSKDNKKLENNEILNKIKNIYVNDDPRAWWLSLSKVKKIVNFDDDSGYKHIIEILLSEEIEIHEGEFVYFIADSGEDLLLYEIIISDLIRIIENGEFFEYYISALDYSWMTCENDHGDIIVCY